MESLQSKIVDDLLVSYQEVGGINRIDSANLPSRPAVAGLCEDLLRLVFPGFLETEAIESENLEIYSHIEEMCVLCETLTELVFGRSLCRNGHS